MAKKKVKKVTIVSKLTDLHWDTNRDNRELDSNGIGNRYKAIDFDDLPTPSPDFDTENNFADVIMEADRVIYEIRDAIIVKFVNAAAARGLNKKTARRFIEKMWKVV